MNSAFLRSTVRRWGGLLAAGLLGVASMSGAGLEPITVRSQSGQFVVQGIPMNALPPAGSTSAVHYLRLDPNLIAVSLERIRSAVRSELRLPDEWRGRVTVRTQTVREEDERVRITSVRFNDGWGYGMQLPELLDKSRFIEAAVQVILLEYANREAPDQVVELPRWLVEGLSARLEATTLAALALEPGLEINQRGLGRDPLANVREILRRRPGISFDELSLPEGGPWPAERSETYRACAQLFVHELLRLREGPHNLREFVAGLPRNLNWQTTFLEAFSDRFPRLIDIDKWYSLQVVTVGGRDALSFFPHSATRQQLDAILATPVEIRIAPDELPARGEAKLQVIVSEWDFARQHPILVDKIRRLRGLQGRAAPELVPLIDGYARALTVYVGKKDLTAPVTERQRSRLKPRGTAAGLIQELDRLDVARDAVRAADSSP